jgi:peptide chain release factor 3
MQFPYRGRVVNLLDTPGHEDFSEDTYRTLTAVDSALMVIDCAKGVEERTIKLMEVCRLRDTPIMTFINKLDREGREPDRAARRDRVACSASSARPSPGRSAWAAAQGHLPPAGRPHLRLRRRARITDRVGRNHRSTGWPRRRPAQSWATRAAFRDEIELVRGATHGLRSARTWPGEQTPVFFGSAISNFGVEELLDAFVEHAPAPRPRETGTTVEAGRGLLTGFVFKIQANMDPAHRDRIAFMRICSGPLRARHAHVPRAPGKDRASRMR